MKIEMEQNGKKTLSFKQYPDYLEKAVMLQAISYSMFLRLAEGVFPVVETIDDTCIDFVPNHLASSREC